MIRPWEIRNRREQDQFTNMATPSLFSLEGHTAVVTGGTRGIGQAVAIALAEAGADLILVQVRRPPSHLRVQARTQASMETLTTRKTARRIRSGHP